MKWYLRKEITSAQWMIILVNLIPLIGVWFYRWDAKSIFLVYCLESVIIGLYNFLQLWLITLVKKKDIWDDRMPASKQSGYLFMFFFLFHYGFFLFVQLSIFLGVMSFGGTTIQVTDLIFHFNRYIPSYAQYLLLTFVVGYGFMVVKEFILTGKYKTVSMMEQMFTPYARILVQQLVVILGSFFLLFNQQGKFFMIVFVAIKVFFEIFINFDFIIKETLAKRKN